MEGFRFETMPVWKNARSVVNELLVFSQLLHSRRSFVIADQLFRAGLSITNNISEGSGSSSRKEFAHFLNISRRSVYECVNILIHCNDLELISADECKVLKKQLETISKQLFAFRKYQLNSLE